ncbi:MAG TPA: hypothetical protein DD417_14170 [Elusimicrobia bacterium]|nr:hypothetical protein [Elusimicrobiota bacterium]
MRPRKRARRPWAISPAAKRPPRRCTPSLRRWPRRPPRPPRARRGARNLPSRPPGPRRRPRPTRARSRSLRGTCRPRS